MATPETPLSTTGDEVNSVSTEPSNMSTPNCASPATARSPSPVPDLHEYFEADDDTYDLPPTPISITKFDGTYWHFKPFWDDFQAIHNNPTLSPSDKMSCLKGKCVASAATKFAKWKVSDEAYGDFVKLLHYTYGDTELAVQKLYDSFDKLRPITDSVKHVRILVSNMDHFLKLLEYHGETVDNGMIRHSYVSRFPDWVKDGIPHRSRNSIKDIQRAVRIQIARQKRFENRRPAPSCLFCGKHRYTSDCRIVKSVPERLTLLHQLHRCLNCLKGNHIARDCRKEVICYRCKGHHNTVLCRFADIAEYEY